MAKLLASRTILIGPTYHRSMDMANKLNIPRTNVFTAKNPSNLQGWDSETIIIVVDAYEWPHYSLNLLNNLADIGVELLTVNEAKDLLL